MSTTVGVDTKRGEFPVLDGVTAGASTAAQAVALKPKLDVTTRVFQAADWDTYRDDIVRIERVAFADTPGGGFPEEGQRRNFLRKDAGVVIMIDNVTGKLIGYTNTYPDGSTKKLGDTHYIDNTAFDPAYQGKGLVKPLMDVLEAHLKSMGVDYVTRDSRNYNPGPDGRTYAQKVIEANQHRIVDTHEHGSPWGPQIRIKMSI